jgi:hypothetical protein
MILAHPRVSHRILYTAVTYWHMDINSPLPFGDYRPAEMEADEPVDGLRSRCEIRFCQIPSGSERPLTVFY